MAARGLPLDARFRILIPLSGAAGIAAIACAAFAASAAPPSSGDWVVTGNETYANQTIVIEGNVFVRAPGQLTLINVTLEINSTSSARRGLLVEAGATLRTRDTDGLTLTSLDRTVVRPVTSSERIFVVAAPGSAIDLRQSALWGVGYTQSPPNASGLYIQTNATTLQNVTVFSSFFGIVFIGVVGQFQDISVHNNTYNGLDLDALSNLTVRGFLAADNGGAGVHIAGGAFTLVGASVLGNADGVAVKFGGTASASLFDVSGNDNGFVALNGATLRVSMGRSTNNTLSGVDARQSCVVTVDGVAFSDNPTALYGILGSSYAVQGGGITRGIRAVQLRSGSYASLTGVQVEAAAGDALDLDTSSADIFSSVFEANAFGGSITASTSFAFLDSRLSNSTGGGFTFTNSTGVYLHNPAFINNRGRAVDLAGSSTAILDATAVAEINRSVVDVRSLSVVGTLRVIDATLHAVAATSWTLSGNFVAANSTIVGDVAGASLTLQGGASASVRGLAVADFDFRLSGASPFADIDGILHTGSGELSAGGGNYTWANVTQGPGSGRIRVANGNLTLVLGSALLLRAEAQGRIDLVDFAASVSGAAYAGSGAVREFWTARISTLWAPSVAAPFQDFTLRDAANATAFSGQTDLAGLSPAALVQSAQGTVSGTVSRNPHLLTAGAGGWAASASITIDAPGTYSVTLSDTAAPTVSITAPAGGAVVSGNPVAVTGTASDAESGVASVSWSFDNVTFTAGSVADPFTLLVPAAFETTYLVTVRAIDLAGNPAFAAVSYRVDRTPPTVSLSQPLNGSAVRGPTVRFAGGTEVGAALTINGTSVPVDAQGDFDALVPVPEGVITVALTAVDAAGNVFFMEISLRVDASAPGIAVSFPLNGSTVASLTVDLVGFVEPGAGFTVDGVAQLALPNGSFNVSIDLLAEGLNRIVIRAVDAAGNTNQTEWVLFRDTAAPQVSVLELAGVGPWSFNTTAPPFHISTNEYAFIEASVSPGGASTSASGTALLFTPALSEGSFVLTVTAEDAGGNRRATTFSLRVDIAAPTFTLDNRTQAGFVNVSPYLVTLYAEPGALVTVGGVAATPTAPGSSTYEATIALQPGANSVPVTVEDAAGNRASRTLTLTLDQTPPSLSITAPAQGARTAETRITVGGEVEPGATVTVSGRAVPVDASGHFATLINIAMGSNSIVVVATDPAGNSATLTLAVTRADEGQPLFGVQFLNDNLWAILFLVALAAAGGLLAMRGGDRRRALDDKSAALERDLGAARAARNDLNALENFSPRTVDNPDFVSSEEFRKREGERQADAPPAGSSGPPPR